MNKATQMTVNHGVPCTVEDNECYKVSPVTYTTMGLVANLGGAGLTISGISASVTQVPCEQNDHVAVVEATVKTNIGDFQMVGAASPSQIQGDKDVVRLISYASKIALSNAADMALYVRTSNFMQEQRLKEEE